MAYDYPAANAVTLPNLFLTPGEALKDSIALNERRKERAADEAASKAQNEQAAKARNMSADLSLVNDATDEKNFKSIIPRVRDFIHTTLADKKAQYLQLAQQGVDPVQLQMYINNDMVDIGNWYNKANAAAEKMDNEFNLKKAEGLNVPVDEAYNYLINKFGQTYLKQDKDGNLTMVDPTLIDDSKSFVSDLSNPEILSDPNISSQFSTIDLTPVNDFFASVKTQPFSDKSYNSKAGKSSRLNWSGQVTPYTPTDENGRPIPTEDANGLPASFGIATTQVADSTGQIRTLPSEQLLSDINNAPAKVKTALGVMWQQYKRLGNLSFANKADEELAMKEFIGKQAAQKLRKVISVSQAEVTPKQTTVNNINIGGANSFKDVYKPLFDSLQDGEYQQLRDVDATAATLALERAKKDYPNVDLTPQNTAFYRVGDKLQLRVVNYDDTTKVKTLGDVLYANLDPYSFNSKVNSRKDVNKATNNPKPKATKAGVINFGNNN